MPKACGARRALEPEQQPVIEAGRIVDAVLVENESGGKRAQLDEPVPVGRVAGEAGDLETHDDARLAERHLAHQLLEAVARGGTRAGLAEIAIDDADALGRPPRGNRAIAEPILARAVLSPFSATWRSVDWRT